MAEAKKINIEYDRRELSDSFLLELYRRLLYPRMIEEKMLVLLRQGRISKWFSGIGQEAISVGCASAMDADELMFTMHRNLGVFTTRNIPLRKLFAQWQGKQTGFTRGRDRSFHFGTMEYNIVGMISHLGPQLSLADGVGLAHKLSGERKATLAFTGEGGTSEGEFHEALNLAAVWDLPVLFVIENNGYGLSTPVSEQYRCEWLSERAQGYGMEGRRIDGNNILEVYHQMKECAESAREEKRPFLIECLTFRMRGHEEASGTKYVPDNLFEQWKERDPVENFEEYLLAEKVLDREEVERIRADYKKKINEEVAAGMKEEEAQSSESVERRDVFAPFQFVSQDSGGESREMRFVDAVREGLDESMQRFEKLVLMGQDIAEYGGVFKVTEGFVEKYGRDRVRNTPLCESAVIGAALGLSFKGYKSMVEMQFADFVSCGFNQIVNNLAKIHYRWQQNADVVIRMPTGGGMGAGPFHSQSNEAWFAHVPGLKVVYPATPEDAKGLLATAFEDPNPVMYFEHKGLYRKISGPVPQGYYNLPFGKARQAAEGADISIITYGMGVHWALEECSDLDISADIIDLRTLVPLDYEAIENSVRKTNRALILHEDTFFAGIGAEIAAYIGEELFRYLDAPVIRCASMDTPVPFAPALENTFMAKSRLRKSMNEILNY